MSMRKALHARWHSYGRGWGHYESSQTWISRLTNGQLPPCFSPGLSGPVSPGSFLEKNRIFAHPSRAVSVNGRECEPVAPSSRGRAGCADLFADAAVERLGT